jgi:hypothetical protein
MMLKRMRNAFDRVLYDSPTKTFNAWDVQGVVDYLSEVLEPESAVYIKIPHRSVFSMGLTAADTEPAKREDIRRTTRDTTMNNLHDSLTRLGRAFDFWGDLFGEVRVYRPSRKYGAVISVTRETPQENTLQSYGFSI